MNGFGFDREKRLLVKVIQAQDKNKFQTLVQKLTGLYGVKKIANWIVKDILPSVALESSAWAYKIMGDENNYKKITDKSLQVIFQVLVQKGFTPGKDFSMHPKGGFILSDACTEALLKEVPEKYRQKVRSEIIQMEQTFDRED